MVAIPHLSYPFFGSYDVSYVFGATGEDPVIQKQYLSWGVQGHTGIDFALPVGTIVLAVAAGEIVQAGDNGAFGLSVVIHHYWGDSLYAHLQQSLVQVGRRVVRAEKIALSGATGFVTGPHLHLGIKPESCNVHNGFCGYIDPLPYLSSSQRKMQKRDKK